MNVPSKRLPRAIYTAAQVRELDRRATDDHSVPSYDLMRRAGAAALEALQRRWPTAARVVVYCGAGNNGGDGYALASLARAAGLAASVVALVPAARLRGNAAQAERDCRAAGVPIDAFKADRAPPAADVLVDALLGIGVDRPVTGDFAAAIATLNLGAAPVLALDLPSGLDGDTGEVRGVAVRAQATLTFVGLKSGLFLGAAFDHCGDLEFAGLGLPAELIASTAPALVRLDGDDLRRALPRRARSANKGSHGRVLLVGGGPSMAGAIRLAAEAALRTGAGLVYVGTHPANAAEVLGGRPEVICRGIMAAEDLDEWLGVVDGVVIGPGLGKSSWAESLWCRVCESTLPLVVDADALNLLAAAPLRRGNWILTPHPGEAGRLLGLSAGEVQRDRLAAARELGRRYGGIVVLKGAGTLVAGESDEAIAVCDRGNPGMATGGTGDVLAGALGALLVQTREPSVAARAGVLLHALAGDSAARAGERGMIASDLLAHLRQWANPS